MNSTTNNAAHNTSTSTTDTALTQPLGQHLQWQKLIRHALMQGCGWAAVHGYALDPENLVGFMVSLFVIVASLIWSWGSKAEMPESFKALVTQIAEVLGTHFAGVFTGWLQARGVVEGNTELTTAAALAGLGNYWLSARHMPDDNGRPRPKPKRPPPREILQRIGLLLCVCPLLCSCHNVMAAGKMQDGSLWAVQKGSIGEDADKDHFNVEIDPRTGVVTITHTVDKKLQAKGLRDYFLSKNAADIIGATAKGTSEVVKEVGTAVSP